MKLLLAVIPILAVLPVVAADLQPFAPAPLQLELPRPPAARIPIAGVPAGAGGERVPSFDRFYTSGASHLRGFHFRDSGPKDEDGELVGGNSVWRLTAEDFFPAGDEVRRAFFYDVGFVDAGSYADGGEANGDAGLGVRLVLPIGRVRLDYGLYFHRDAHDGSSGKFQPYGDFPGPGYREQRARFLDK